MDDVKLLPCPFCGATQAEDEHDLYGVWVEGNDHDDRIYHVRCWCCGSRGRETGDRDQAIVTWNTRTPSPDHVIMREALELIVAAGKGYRDSGWGYYSDGYGAARIEAAEIAREALSHKGTGDE